MERGREVRTSKNAFERVEVSCTLFVHLPTILDREIERRRSDETVVGGVERDCPARV